MVSSRGGSRPHDSFSSAVGRTGAGGCHHPAVTDDDVSAGVAGPGPARLDSLDDVVSLHDLTEHGVLTVQERGPGGTQEELRTIGVGTRIGHGQDARARVREREVLIRKRTTVDGTTSRPVVVSEIAALARAVGFDMIKWETAGGGGGRGLDIGSSRHRHAKRLYVQKKKQNGRGEQVLYRAGDIRVILAIDDCCKCE